MMSLYDPRNRKELYYRGILDQDPGSLPDPQTREEIYLKAIAEHTSKYYGSPLTAATVADMTDEDRVYVYTGTEEGYTAGDWYYWDGSAWVDGGVYNAIVVQTDTTLTEPGVAADAKATGDKIDLIIYPDINLFNKNDIISGYYLTGSGTQTALAGGMISNAIPAQYGDVFKTKYSSIVGTSYAYFFNSSDVYVTRVAGVRDGDYVTYTAPNATYDYVKINNSLSVIDTLMIVKGDYPGIYIPYSTVALKDNVTFSQYQEQTIDNKLSEIVNSPSKNLFDQNGDLKHGYFSGSSFTANESYRMTAPIIVEAGVVYRYPQSTSLGATVTVPFVDASGTFLGTKTTGSCSDGVATFTPATDGYVSINIGLATEVGMFYVYKNSDYTADIEPYGRELNENVLPEKSFHNAKLNGKTILYDGDSICYGQGDIVKGYGYAQRVGSESNMRWKNFAASGATITPIAGVTHVLSTYIDTIFATFTETDYLILEGGTNDADRLGAGGLGIVSDDYSGTYDTTTFSGALETLFYKALSYYPTAKIGYIVAPKMGTWDSGSSSMILPSIRKQFFDRAVEICEKWGVSYLNLWDNFTMNPCLLSYYDHSKTAQQNYDDGLMYADGQHPNGHGYDYMYPIIASWINSL